jgi:uncharacterized protein YegP (UPF0339 family)
MDLHLSRSKQSASPKVANDRAVVVHSSAVATPKRRPGEANSRFDIYRTDLVRLTSTLHGGGDWHWRLVGASGAVIADCGGYPDEAQCLAAVRALRIDAGLAPILNTMSG